MFNPREHLMQLKSREGSKDYLPVQYRLVWFREAFPQGSIETELIHLDLDKDTEDDVFVWNNEKRRSEKMVKTAKGIAVFKATVKDGIGGVATGTKSEKAASFADFIEKAETGAIGRALAALGYGTQFAPELDEGSRIVDAPVERSQDEQQPAPQQQTPHQISAPNTSKSPQNGASVTVTAQRENKPAPVSNRPSQASQQPSAVLNMLKRAKTRAEQLNLDWESEKANVLGKAIPDNQLTVQHLASINGDLTKAEQQQKAS